MFQRLLQPSHRRQGPRWDSSGCCVSQRVAAVAPGHGAFRHNYWITQQWFPPLFPSSTLHLCLRSSPAQLIPPLYVFLIGPFFKTLIYRNCLLLSDCCDACGSVQSNCDLGAPPPELDCSLGRTGKEQREVNQGRLPTRCLSSV